MKVCFETFGCRLNKAEALQMEADYLANGWEVTKKHSDANLIVVRGCSVTTRAQRECEKLVAHIRRHYPATQIMICGCLAGKDIAPQPVPSIRMLGSRTAEHAVPARTARAYLKVQDGCAGKCTFCIVPRFRGTSRSEPFSGILDQARRIIDVGYREIVVTGCNLSLYASEGKRLPELLAALADLAPSCRVRLGSLEPGSCALETVHAMAERPNVCRFLHLPIQSGSNKVLLAMQRPYDVKDIEEAAALAADLMPNVGLGCDVIAGFPGETELDHAATKGLLRRLAFSNAHVFPYSRRPNTLAAGFPRQISRDVRAMRARDLAEAVRSMRRKFAMSFIGKTVEIVVEDEKSGRGWTSEYLPCEPIGSHPARKSTARVLVTKTRDDLLVGRCQ